MLAKSTAASETTVFPIYNEHADGEVYMGSYYLVRRLWTRELSKILGGADTKGKYFSSITDLWQRVESQKTEQVGAS